jgi:hypothetical protein
MTHSRLRIDARGRSEAEIKALLHAAYRAMLGAFGVPPRDRYQILTEHLPIAHGDRGHPSAAIGSSRRLQQSNGWGADL